MNRLSFVGVPLDDVRGLDIKDGVSSSVSKERFLSDGIAVGLCASIPFLETSHYVPVSAFCAHLLKGYRL